MQSGSILQAKGHDYTLTQLLSEASPQPYRTFATLYLSPRDYHRVHLPIDAQLLQTRYIPGRLFSVNPKSTENIPHIFTRNERLVCYFHSNGYDYILVFVAALIVGGIETVWAKETPRQAHITDYRKKNIRFCAGDEIGRFHFGSTIILLLQYDTQWAVVTDRPIKMGQLLATYDND